MGNIEYFEIAEINPYIQCPNCLTYRSKGIVYCTCGTCLRPSNKVRKLNSDWHDVLSTPSYVIKKGPSHGRRHENTERQRIYHEAKLASRKAKKYKSIQDRFLRCPIYRKSLWDIGWTEEHCARLDEIAAEDHSYVATTAERARRENTWVIVHNSSGPNGP